MGEQCCGYLEIGVGNDLLKKAFKSNDRVELQKLLLQKFGAKQFDEGLEDGVNFIRDRVQTNLGNASGTSVATGRSVSSPKMSKLSSRKWLKPPKTDT